MNQKFLNVSILILALSFCLSLTSCGRSDASTENNTVSSDLLSSNDGAEKPKPAPTPPPINDGGDMSNVVVDIEVGETEAVSLNWKMGKMDPSELKILNAQNYSYSDVITVKKAGTTVTFVDDNSNDNGDGAFAGSDVLVISSWQKNHSGAWISNGQGANYMGSGTDLSQITVSDHNGVVTYSYTTVADDENIVLCFRSGQTETYTPESFPTVTAVFKRSIVSYEVGDGYAEGNKLTAIF
ncbi:MAG: hypothetical protein IKC59_08605 [Clostridia bacterium]|nr:hypothetical protein [Clostridia bacterium]